MNNNVNVSIVLIKIVHKLEYLWQVISHVSHIDTGIHKYIPWSEITIMLL